jgi:hypothetical protein
MDPIIETASSLLPTTPNIQRPNPREVRAELDIDRVVLSNSLRLYIREAWHVVEPSTIYLENWHIDLIARRHVDQ